MGIEQMITDRQEQTKAYREEKQVERDTLNSMRDAQVMEATSYPEKYLDYLDLQAKNPQQSAGNVLLAIAQLTEPTVFFTESEWKEVGRYVTPQERPHGALIFKPGKNSYVNPTPAFDIAQTSGRPLRAPEGLAEGSPEMQKALGALLRFAQREKVATTVDKNLDRAVLYDECYLSIAVNPSYNEAALFQGLAVELALARAHNNGYNQDYRREEYEFDAMSTAYLLCSRYGVPCQPPNLDYLPIAYPEEFSSAKGRSKVLDDIHLAAKLMGKSIENEIHPQHQQERGRYGEHRQGWRGR